MFPDRDIDKCFQEMILNRIINSDCLEGLKTLPDNSIDCCVTSPPYWGLRDYGHEGQIGMEETPDSFVKSLVWVFGEVKRALKPEGTLWLNLGDTYSAHKDCKSVADTLRVGGNSEAANVIDKGKSHSRNSKVLKSIGLKNKDLIGIPWMVAFALRSNGWYLRQDIIWHKPNPMPESVTDRCTKAHEYIFLLSKSAKYFYDSGAIKTKMECGEHDKRARQGRKRFPTELVNGIRGNTPDKIYEWANKRSVWTVNTKPYSDAHFATFPEELIEDCIKAGCPKGGIVLDPFMGAGTTAVVSKKLERNFIGFELNKKYIAIAEKRMFKEFGMFHESIIAA